MRVYIIAVFWHFTLHSSNEMFVVIKFVTEVRAGCILSEMQERLCKDGDFVSNV